MNTIRVETWNDLHDELFADSWNETLGRHRSSCAFRGCSDTNFSLESALMRLGGNYEELERHLIRNFRKYAHKDVVERDSFWNWLTLAQHHGLPTRMLDWTYSPFVALHFATVNLGQADSDGCIWKLDYHKASALLPHKLRSRLDELSANVFTTDILSEQVDSLEEFDLLSKRDFLMFIEPPSIDDRIVNQFALFSMISNPRRRQDEWLESHPDIYVKIEIPAALKWEVRDRLDQSNVTERVLFPGLDGLSSWLKRHYSPR
ncbi:MAG: hypothetical protein ACI9DC_004775 [Gammaproteobacteria bacterium]|jgi:hypothetical protein